MSSTLPALVSDGQPRRRLRKNMLWLLGVAVGGALLALVLSRVDLAVTAESAMRLSPAAVAILFITILATYLLDPVVQFVLLRNPRITLLQYITLVCKVQPLSLVLPSKAADLGIFVLLRDESRTKVAAAYLYSKVITAAVVLVLAWPIVSKLSMIRGIVLSMVVVTAVVLAILLPLSAKWIAALAPAVPVRRLRILLEASVQTKPTLGSYVGASAIAVGRMLIAAAGQYALVRALGADPGYVAVVTVVALVFVAGTVPFIPFGLGIVEVVFVSAYALYGVDSSVSLLIPLVGRVLQLVCFGLFALLYLLPQPVVAKTT